MFTGSLSLPDIIASQQNGWWIFRDIFPPLSPLSFFNSRNCRNQPGPFWFGWSRSELSPPVSIQNIQEWNSHCSSRQNISMYLLFAPLPPLCFLGGWMPFHIGNWAFNHVMDYIPSSIWFFWQNLLLILWSCGSGGHSPPAHWPVTEFRMEIFIAHQYDQPVAGNSHGDTGMAFLES